MPRRTAGRVTLPCPSGVWVPAAAGGKDTLVRRGLTHFPLPIWPELSSPGAPSCPGGALLCSQPQTDGAGRGLSAEPGNPPRKGPGKGALVGLREETRTECLSGSDVSFAFSPAEQCGFIKATKALASRYVDMHQCGSSLFCQVGKAARLRSQTSLWSECEIWSVCCLLENSKRDFDKA